MGAVLGEHDPCVGVEDALGQRIRREATEHDGVDGADAGARQHGDRQLGDHAHVDGDPVALADAQRLQPVGELRHLGVELAVRDGAGVAGLADPVVGDLVAVIGEVAVEAVETQVELAVSEPFEEGRVRVVEPFGRLLEPRDAVESLSMPEGLEVGLGLVIDRGGGVRLGHELRGGREDPILGEQVLDRLLVGHVPLLARVLQS